MRIVALLSAAAGNRARAALRTCVTLIAIVLPGSLPQVGMAATPLPVVSHTGWQEKCGDCHMLYHPGLLPARSWERLMEGLKKHFGRNVGMDAALRADITAFLVANAADRSGHPLSQTIAKSLSTSDRPTRVSTTRWFETAHANIRKVEHFEQCVICHRRSPAGDFAVVH